MNMHHEDIDPEPIRGLPELLPEGETIVWQGAPDWWALAKHAFKVKWVAGYFVLLFAWRGLVASADMAVGPAFLSVSFYLVLGGIACGLLMAVAWVQAKATVYTLTNQRVILRIGAALTMTVQFPYLWVGAADLVTQPDGTGTIALRTLGKTRFSYLLMWPHARPWRFAKTQPALRCIPEAAKVARLLAETVEAGPPIDITEDPVRVPAGAMPVPAE
ncbi:MAG: photosynthetic complex putative assembly protein PuhB [Pseudomonadota bacterium]